MSAAVDVYTITWTGRSVVLPLFGGNSVGAVEASATAPVEALRRTAPQGWTRATKTRRGRPLYPRARKGGDAGGRPRRAQAAGVVCVGPVDWSARFRREVVAWHGANCHLPAQPTDTC